MKRGFFGGVLSALLLCGCATASPHSKSTADVPSQPPQASFVVDPAPDRGRWVLRAFRQLDGFKTEGIILLSSDITPPPDTQHAALAGSRAFLLLGQERQRAGDFPRAIAAAKAGLAELGSDYAPPMTFDDTSLSIGIAQEEVQHGHPARGAERILRALRARIRMYVRKHTPFVSLPADEEPKRAG